jgi:tRNA (cmo5U34)-methyltransferase
VTAEIQKRFEEAAQYDNMMAKVFPGYEQLPLLLLSYLRTRLGSRAHLLDVGCGTGDTLAVFAAHQPEWSFVGVDPAEPMLELARRKINALGVEDRVALMHGTVSALPNEPRFDAATCILVEHLQPDDGSKLQLLKEIQRRISSGGWLVLLGLHGDLSTAAAQNALEAWLEFVALQGLPKTTQDNVRHRATVEDSLVSEQRIQELLEGAGFVNVERIYQVELLGGWCAQKLG